MTTATVQTFDPNRGTGVVCCVAGTPVPFSSADRTLSAGDEIAVRLVGGICGLYATHVAPAAASRRVPVGRPARALAA